MWSRTAYDRYLEWAMEAGTTDNGVFGAKLMWGYFGDFVSLLRNIPAYRDLPLAELLPAVFPDLTFVRVVRANKIRQAVSLWKAVQTASWRQEGSSVADGGDPPYRSYLDHAGPQVRFHYRAISHLLDGLLAEEASWDAFFEHTRIKPELVLYENFAADYETSTRHLIDRLGLELPPDWEAEPRMTRPVRRAQRRLGAALRRAPPRDPLRPRPGGPAGRRRESQPEAPTRARGRASASRRPGPGSASGGSPSSAPEGSRSAASAAACVATSLTSVWPNRLPMQIRRPAPNGT